jgi:hypothetical protein
MADGITVGHFLVLVRLHEQPRPRPAAPRGGIPRAGLLHQAARPLRSDRKKSKGLQLSTRTQSRRVGGFTRTNRGPSITYCTNSRLVPTGIWFRYDDRCPENRAW